MTARDPGLTHIAEILDESQPRARVADAAQVARVRRWIREINLAASDELLDVLALCESGAEVRLLIEYAASFGAVPVNGDHLERGDTVVIPQLRVRLYRIDFLVRRDAVKLAIEVDGLGFHHREPEQIEHDYLRDRRLLLDGYPTMRFTAREVFSAPAQCWSEIEGILDARGA